MYLSLKSTNLNSSTSDIVSAEVYDDKASQENMAAQILTLRSGYLLDDLVT